jgi:ABC-2 type transport system permease protein
MRILRAYPTLLRVGFAGAVAYRAEMLIWMLTMTMPLVSLALWSSVASSGPVGRFGQPEFAAYFLATLVVRQLTGSWLIWELNQEIKSGALGQRLLKPLHPLVAYSAENLAALPLRALLSVPIAIVALFVAGSSPVAVRPAGLALFALSLVGAWLINYFTMAIIGSLAFFMESSAAVFDLWLAAFMVLSGYLVPLELFPDWLRSVAEVLPFRYMVAYPVELAIGLMDLADAARALAIQWAYAAAGFGLALLAWKAGMRRFSAFGG